jgi:hypothetical protein
MILKYTRCPFCEPDIARSGRMSAIGPNQVKRTWRLSGKTSSSDCKLGFDIRRQFTAVGSELHHDLLMQPDIHLR